MRLGTVIGRVTLSQTVPSLLGARWLIVSPFTREHFQQGTETPPGMSKEPSLVVYDDLGGGVGKRLDLWKDAKRRRRLKSQRRSMQSTPCWWTRFFTIHLRSETSHQRQRLRRD